MNEDNELTPQTPEEEPQKKSKVDPNVMRGIRIFIGGYLIYLAYQLYSGIRSGTAVGRDLVICAIAAGVFTLVGAALVIFSLRQLLRQK